VRPAYTRLGVEERRRRLLELGTTLFARHDYDALSMAAIAREAGISKALLYHYFPSKQAYFVATLEQKAEELAARVAPDPALAPAEQLAASLDAFLRWVEENGDAYAKLVRGAGAVPEVREVMEAVRAATAAQILAGLPGAPSPARRAAVRAWLWFMDGAILDWLEHGDLAREDLHALLLRALAGALGEPV
jgi:AcrR family transcriptional regulator